MSTDSEIRDSIEMLRQTMRDAKRLRKELASQIKEIDEKLKRNKEATSKSKKTGT